MRSRVGNLMKAVSLVVFIIPLVSRSRHIFDRVIGPNGLMQGKVGKAERSLLFSFENHVFGLVTPFLDSDLCHSWSELSARCRSCHFCP